MYVQTAPFDSRPCRCVTRHTPRPEATELHHVFPAGVQRELWGEVRDRTLEPLCPTGHRAVHAVIDALLAGRKPPRVNKHCYDVATDGVARIKAARADLQR